MKYLRALLSAFLLAALLAGSLAGCGHDSSANQVVRFALDAAPVHLDPQLAQSEAELLIVRNTMEGLLRYDAAGKLQNGVCESWSVSEDRTTYTFSLRKNAVWADETPLTAQDFAFGLTRALLPETAAPFAQALYAIHGAQQVHAGTASADTLGVRALDEQTLEIRLSVPDENFPSVLTQAVAMPCNRAFFEGAGGRYGLDSDTLLCNGPFYLRSWDEGGDSARLSRNDAYKGDFSAKPAAVSLYFGQPTEELLKELEEDKLDAAVLDCTALGQAREAGLRDVQFHDTAWSVLVNPNAPVLGSEAAARALSLSLDRAALAKDLPEGFALCDGVVAPDALAVNKPYRPLSKAGRAYSYDPDRAKADFTQALQDESYKSLPESTLLYVEGGDRKLVASRLAQAWQQTLGAFLNIEAVSADELRDRTRSGNYQLALCPVSAGDHTARGALAQFSSKPELGAFGYENPQFDAALDAAGTGLSDEALAEALSDAENVLLADSRILPVFSSATCYVFSPALTGFSPDRRQGSVDFSGVGKQ